MNSRIRPRSRLTCIGGAVRRCLELVVSDLEGNRAELSRVGGQLHDVRLHDGRRSHALADADADAEPTG